MSEIAIAVHNLSKTYRLYDRPVDRLKEAFHPLKKKYHHNFFALRDVSFSIKKGETFGILGKNGSGKSTLLKIITGVLTPSEGKVDIKGRISALLELGSGFNPELTGLENVFFNGAILGFTKEQMASKLESILQFADIGEFVHQPVKTYSSGMVVRLAFAVNVMIEPEIMIVDEALAVGDMNFQAKCMTALQRIRESGATVLFVSHDIGAVKSLCSSAVLLEHGVVKQLGKASDVAETYIRMMREEMNAEQKQFARNTQEFSDAKPVQAELPVSKAAEFKTSEEFDKRVAQFRYGSGAVKISYVELLNSEYEPIKSAEFNELINIRIYLSSFEQSKISVGFHILDEKKNNLTGCSFPTASVDLLSTQNNEHYIITYSLRIPFQEGNYSIAVLATAPLIVGLTATFLDVVPDAIVFSVGKWEKAKLWSPVYLFPTLKITKLLNASLSSEAIS